MKYQLIGVLLNLGLLYVGVQPAPIDAYEVIDFYKLFNNPNAHISVYPRRTTADRIADHGYPVEHHKVVTEDGYVLGLFRIPYSHKLQNKAEKRPIAILQHGLFGCSDDWVSIGPNDALPFLLADAGFDVWLGNARGNTYSRNHTTRSISLPSFWRFSWHEIGHYDVAAMIDNALRHNNQSAVHYVGHSQGTTAFFALLSTRPEYNRKIRTAHMLAPVAFMNHMDSLLVRLLAPYLGHHNTYSKLFATQEFLPYNEYVLSMLYNTCHPESKLKKYCGGQQSTGRQNTTILPEMLSTHPAGVSTDQILHYMQEQQSGHYRQFDFGEKKNLRIYGTQEPPDYPVSLITADMHLWYGDNDEMAAVVDVLRLAKQLPNKIMHHMEDPLWDHGDFAVNLEVRKLINEPIIEIMLQYENNHS